MTEIHTPIGLLRRLAVGDASEEEIAFVVAWMEADGLIQPPASVLRRAQRIPRAERPSPLRRLVGLLLPAGPSLPSLVGTRGPVPAQVLTFDQEGMEIEVELDASGFERYVTGQALGGEWSVARLETVSGELVSSVDAAGMFAFPAAREPRALLLVGEDVELRLTFPLEAAR